MQRVLLWSATAAVVVVALYSIWRFWTYDTYFFNSAAATLEDQRAAAKAEGLALEPDDLREKPPVPASQNAAPEYTAIIADMRPRRLSPLFYQPLEDWAKKPTAANLAKAKKKLSELAPFLARLQKNSTKPRCDFDWKYEEGPLMVMPEMPFIKPLVRVLAVRARLDAYEGKNEEALAGLRTALRISGHAGDEPVLIAMLVRLASEAAVLRSIDVLLSVQASDERLIDDLEELLRQWPAPPDLRRHLRFGLVESIVIAREYDLEKLDEVGGLFGVDPQRITQQRAIKVEATTRKEAYEARVIEAWRIVDAELRKHKGPKAGAASATKALSELPLEADPAYFLVSIALPEPLDRMGGSIIRIGVERDLLLAKIELMRFKAAHGRFPSRLDQAVKPINDPFSGRPVIYQGERDRFFLRSVGYNGQDDRHTSDDIRVEHPLDPKRAVR